MEMNSGAERHRNYWWFMAAALLVPFTYGLACASVSSDAQQPERYVIGPVDDATFEQLVIHSHAIVVGKVVNIEVNKADNGADYRLVTLNVEQLIKGEASDRIVLRVPGGEESSNPDIAQFYPGERVLVLLDRGTGSFTLNGGAKGKFSIDNDNIGDRPLAWFISQVRNILAKHK